MKFTSVILTLSAVVAMAQAAPILGDITGAAGDLPLVGGVVKRGVPLVGDALNGLPLVGGVAKRGVPLVGDALSGLPLVGGVAKRGVPLVGDALNGLPLVGGVAKRGVPIVGDVLNTVPLVGGTNVDGTGVDGTGFSNPIFNGAKRGLPGLDALPLPLDTGLGGSSINPSLSKRDLPVPTSAKEIENTVTNIVGVSKNNLVEAIVAAINADVSVSVDLHVDVQGKVVS